MTIINCDMGEAFGLYKMGDDAGLMPLIDVANVACGFHASDFNHMRSTVQLAKQHGVKVGAHPSLPDLQGFGRREMKISREELANCIIYQVGALKGFLEAEGLALNHIKPHGSLFGMLSRDESLMQAAAKVAKSYGVPIFGLAGTAHETVTEREGVEFVSELYVDLNYNAEGGLIILRRPENTDPAQAATRVRRALADGTVLANDGTELQIPFGSVCVHSDTSNSPAVAGDVREALGR